MTRSRFCWYPMSRGQEAKRYEVSRTGFCVRSDSDDDSRKSVTHIPPGPTLTGTLLCTRAQFLARSLFFEAGTVTKMHELISELLIAESGFLGVDMVIRALIHMNLPAEKDHVLWSYRVYPLEGGEMDDVLVFGDEWPNHCKDNTSNDPFSRWTSVQQFGCR